MLVKSTPFKQVCQLLLSLIVDNIRLLDRFFRRLKVRLARTKYLKGLWPSG